MKRITSNSSRERQIEIVTLLERWSYIEAGSFVHYVREIRDHNRRPGQENRKLSYYSKCFITCSH